MEKINIAELLKDCPTGMALDCAMWDNLYFDRVDDDLIHCYYELDGYRNATFFSKNGCYTAHELSKCVIFPKGKATWEGFQRPFKEGDVAVTEKGHIHLLRTKDSSYCAYRGDWKGLPKYDSTMTTGVEVIRFATEEEKQKLFDAIKANGYKWDAETKTLEKLIEPKFKVGDKIQWDSPDYRPIRVIKSLECDRYRLDNGNYIKFGEEGAYKLLKFDITTLKPFDKVLVRNVGVWEPAFWGYYSKKYVYPFVVAGGNTFAQCVPYEENKHLLGTTNDCDDYFKTWE